MKANEYVQWLITTNLKQLQLADDSDFGTDTLIANFGFGILEEYFEYTKATVENQPNEAGDVLAYYVLLCISLGFSRDHISGRIASTATEYSLYSNVGELASALKRLFRGDSGSAEVERCAYVLLLWTIGDVCIQAEALADLNRIKLTDRLERLLTFHGSGDNR